VTILFVAHSQDSQCVELMERVSNLSRGVARLAVDQLPSSTVCFGIRTPVDSRSIEVAGNRIQLDDVTAVYSPNLVPSSSPRGLADEALTLWEDEWQAALNSLYVLTPEALWVNPPTSALQGQSRMYQLNTARAVGLRVPQTLVTNDASQIAEFARDLKGPIVVKRLASMRRRPSGGRITRKYFTRRLSIEEAARLDPDRVRACPLLVQEYVEKASDVRAFVIGSQVIGCEILSQVNPETTVDWRHYPTRVVDGVREVDPDRWFCRPVSLPPRVVEQCREVVKRLGLQYSAIDLVATAPGEHVFLEANYGGGYRWMEKIIDLGVSDALAGLLAGASKSAGSAGP